MGRALDMIFAEERAKGRDEGVRQGRAEGTLEGEARALLRVLGRRGIVVDTETEARILATRDLDLLGRWLDRAVDAKTIADVLDS